MSRRRTIRCRRGILGDDRGQSMVFGAITLFTVVAFAVMGLNVARVVATRIRTQNAADAAAYAGALVQANAFSSIAWLNDGMAYLYYKAMRYTVDYAVFDTLNRLVEASKEKGAGLVRGEWAAQGSIGGKGWASPAVTIRYQEAKLRYQAWVGQNGIAKVWLRRMGRAARLIAAATPGLIRKEVWEVAQANGAVAVAMLPEPVAWNGGFAFRGPTGLTPVFEPDDREGFALRNATERIGGSGGSVLLPWEGAGNSGEDWFDPEKGNLTRDADYYQTRVCWHKQDLSHTMPQYPHLLAPSPYNKFNQPLAPNGHWHDTHTHLKWEGLYLRPYTHDNGHFPPQVGTGHEDVVDIWTTEPWNLGHHKTHRCPLCDAAENVKDGRSDIRVWPFTQGKNRSPGGGNSLPDILDARFDRDAMPLRLTPEAVRIGINVACWRPAGTPLVSAVFHDPAWGTVALASARVGIEKGREIQFKELGDLVQDDHRNLYTEVTWGARLVPTTDQDTYLGQGVDRLYQDLLVARWSRDPEGLSLDGAPARALAQMPFAAAGLKGLATH